MIWCVKYLKLKRGFYNDTFLHEAFIGFKKPIQCRFFQHCGNFVSRLNENGHIQSNRSRICPKCYPIYKSGLNDANRKRRTRYGYGNRIGVSDE